MTPKEKAKEIVYKFYGEIKYMERAKRCALIAVDEILKVAAPYIDKHESYYQELDDNQTQVYWQEVKQEIEKL
jgi:hypothetical protein